MSDNVILLAVVCPVLVGSFRKTPFQDKRAVTAVILLESLCRRFAYEVDTKTGPLSLAMHDRAELWRKDFEALKKEVSAESCSVPKFANGVHNKPPYFYTGMQQNERARHR